MSAYLKNTEEDYLRAILEIHIKKGYCRCLDIANHLSVSKPSVTNIVKVMERNSHIYRDDGMIFLTDTGKKIAETSLNKYNFFVKFFQGIGISKEVSINDACSIIRCMSDESYQRITEWYNEIQY